MTRAEILHKLLRLGPLEPLAAREICGWPVDEFANVMASAIADGLVRWRRHTNNDKLLLLEAA